MTARTSKASSWLTIGEEIEGALEAASIDPYAMPDLGPQRPMDEVVPTTSPLIPTTTPIGLDLPPELDPWEQIAGETNREYQYFQEYLRLGLARSRSQQAKDAGVNKRYIDRIAKANFWEKRVVAWDRERERVYAATLIEETREMAKRHKQITARAIEAMAIAFYPLVKRAAEDPDAFAAEVSELPITKQVSLATQAARVLPALMGAERLAHDLPTDISAVQQKLDVDVAVSTREDLAEVVSILSGIRGLSASPPTHTIEAEDAEWEDGNDENNNSSEEE